MVQYDYTGKTVIITGALGDIGKATAKKFLKAGANVVASDICEKQDVLNMLRAVSPKVEYVHFDISNWD